jgi:uncharacterized protein YeaO (DUF488 family)
MELRAKCVRELAAPDDGERLLVSRVRPRGVVQVDGWERKLAPSMKLDFALYRRWITWREYAGLYVADMWAQASLLRELGERATLRPLTLVCTCTDAQRCHRELLARMIARLHATSEPLAHAMA